MLHVSQGQCSSVPCDFNLGFSLKEQALSGTCKTGSVWDRARGKKKKKKRRTMQWLKIKNVAVNKQFITFSHLIGQSKPQSQA
jgi:hypothetical protein